MTAVFESSTTVRITEILFMIRVNYSYEMIGTWPVISANFVWLILFLLFISRFSSFFFYLRINAYTMRTYLNVLSRSTLALQKSLSFSFNFFLLNVTANYFLFSVSACRYIICYRCLLSICIRFDKNNMFILLISPTPYTPGNHWVITTAIKHVQFNCSFVSHIRHYISKS